MSTKFSQEFKDQIVELHRRQGRTLQDLAREFQLSAISVANLVRAGGADRALARLRGPVPRSSPQPGNCSANAVT